MGEEPVEYTLMKEMAMLPCQGKGASTIVLELRLTRKNGRKPLDTEKFSSTRLKSYTLAPRS